jgi:hypothetical protein
MKAAIVRGVGGTPVYDDFEQPVASLGDNRIRVTAPIRFVQVGAASGPDITLPAAVLRSTPIDLMGSGLGSVPEDRLILCIGQLLRATKTAGLKIATKTVPLSEVESAWHENGSRLRTVFTIEPKNF